MANSTQFYEVKLEGAVGQSAVQNSLYYRLAGDVIPGDLNLVGADLLATLVRDQIWTSINPLDPRMKACMPSQYLLKNIHVFPLSETFELIYQSPFTLPPCATFCCSGCLDPCLSSRLSASFSCLPFGHKSCLYENLPLAAGLLIRVYPDWPCCKKHGPWRLTRHWDFCLLSAAKRET